VEPRVDIVSLTYHHPEYLERMAESLDHQTYKDFTMTLVDNGGDEAARVFAQEHKWKYLTYGENLSYSDANNRGVTQGHAPWILLLNDDAIMDPTCLGNLMGHAQQGHQLVGCLIYNTDGTINHAGTTFADGFPTHLGRGFLEPPPECLETPAVTFAVVLIERRLWEALGGLDLLYWYGFEDTDFCLRAREEFGVQSRICRHAKVEHNEHGTRGNDDDITNYGKFVSRWGGSQEPVEETRLYKLFS